MTANEVVKALRCLSVTGECQDKMCDANCQYWQEKYLPVEERVDDICAEAAALIEKQEDALEALHEKQEREKGCEYCNSEAYKSCGAKTIFGLPKVYLGEPDKNSRFKFCPMCGKRLEVKQDEA